MQANGCSTRCVVGGGAAASVTSSPGGGARAARHRGHPHRRDLSEQQADLEGVTHMQTTSTQTPARRDGTFFHIARALGRWFSRAANAIGQRAAKPEVDHWADWPRFPPF